MDRHLHTYIPSTLFHVLTNRPGSLSDLPVIGGGVSVGVTVVMGDSHVIQPIVLWRERARVGQAVRLIGEPIGWAEALGGAYGAGPLAGVNIWVQGTISLKAILFGSGGRKKERHILSLLYCFIFFRMERQFRITHHNSSTHLCCSKGLS